MTPYDVAYEYAMYSNRSIYLTGKAGTGKTTFLRRLQRECPKQIVVCAPTGVAAINAEGVTIHSLFQLPPQVFLPTDSSRRMLFQEMRLSERKRRLLQNLELLVIDEVSMVRADLLDTIDAVLRHVRRRPTLPFGGVQMLFIGDLYQLSPVAKEQEWNLMREYYAGPYFFQARIFQSIRPVYIELDKVYRQTNSDFIELLNQVRSNTLTAEGLATLNARYNPAGRDPHAILLSTHNRKVDAINEEELARLDGPECRFRAEVEKTFPESMYPMEEELVLRKGARVMFIKNDSTVNKAYYNGKIGTVVSLSDDEIVVLCDGESEPIPVHTETWENIRYIPDRAHSDTIRTEIVGTFTHYPLRLAWAVTIHKAQGLTFDKVVIDAADAFAAGQVYVALSRCRTLEGITLLSKIPTGALTNAYDVLQFTAGQPALAEVADALPQAENEYFLAMLCSLYDFRNTRRQLEHIRHMVTEAASFNQPATDNYLHELQDEVDAWQKVGETFQNQLRAILCVAEPDYSYLSERLRGAEGYFAPLLRKWLERLPDSPAYTDDSDDAKTYKQLMEELYTDLSRQLTILNDIAVKPSISRYFMLRRMPTKETLKISAHGADRKVTKEDSDHPTLLSQLVLLRSVLAKAKGVPAFRYAPTSALVLISNKLPKTKSELLKIKGFGNAYYELWGEQILTLVSRYKG